MLNMETLTVIAKAKIEGRSLQTLILAKQKGESPVYATPLIYRTL